MKGVGRAFLIPIITGVLHSFGDVLKDIHGLLGLIVFKEGLGVHIALDINVKDCVERLCQNILNRHLKYVDPILTLDHPTGLELDIYYPQYGFATEVQGEQHEKYIEFFHGGDPNNFIKQQERDQLKKELCEENWIVLRYVWYYEDPYKVIPEHLRELGLIE
ncbi:hypothetical protein F8M41_008180 [Gigaspora margarita]|uniref:Uncharacterized protein n=1 Tax=Gigaspora margarita TaxID=4874 RepID=A0A8H3X6I7_GIGMA|nr:hypothetical protein F8M41_008180 [Gigaspora margarita]